MRKRLVGVFVVSCMALMAVAGTASAGGGNSGAAQACQKGAYLTMQRSDGSSFKNAGDCVSYFAQTKKSACVVAPGVGCLTFDNVVLTNGLGDTLTLNAAYSFNTNCTGSCPTSPNNNDATGGGTYLITDSTGATLEQGTLTTADNPEATFQGLEVATYLASDGVTPTTCSAAAEREVGVFASTGVSSDPYAALVAETYAGTSVAFFGTIYNFSFSGLSTGITLSC